MVGFGQPSIADVSFRNPRHPVVGIHTLRLKDLYRRAPTGAPEPNARHRVPVHLLALVTAGRASFTVDFETYPCRPGGLIWVRPGQFVGFPPPGIDATLVLFEAQFPYDAVGAPAIGPGPTRTNLGTYWQPAGEDSEAIVDGVSQLEIDYARMVGRRRHSDRRPATPVGRAAAATEPARARGRAGAGGGRQRDPGEIPPQHRRTVRFHPTGRGLRTTVGLLGAHVDPGQPRGDRAHRQAAAGRPRRARGEAAAGRERPAGGGGRRPSRASPSRPISDASSLVRSASRLARSGPRAGGPRPRPTSRQPPRRRRSRWRRPWPRPARHARALRCHRHRTSETAASPPDAGAPDHLRSSRFGPAPKREERARAIPAAASSEGSPRPTGCDAESR